MVIEGIEIYRVRVPLASCGRPPTAISTIPTPCWCGWRARAPRLGRELPAYIPNYSAEHTLATFHTVREHMAGRIIGQDIRTAQDLLGHLDFVKATSSRGPRSRSPGGCWRPSARACRCTWPSAARAIASPSAPTSGSRTRSTP